MTRLVLPDYLVDAMRDLPRNIPRLRSAQMVMSDPDTEYLMRGILPKRGVAAIFGPSMSGKSFLAMDFVFHLACGRPSCFLIPIKPAPVVYVALEGQGGLSRRMKAWQRHNGIDLGDTIQILTEPFRLDHPGNLGELADEAISLVGPGCVVVIDTLAQAMAGYDENSSAEMGAAIAGAQRLADKIEGLVILVHHTGKDPTKGPRGHSSFIGALDAAIEVRVRATGRSWKVYKSKDGEAGQEYGFELANYTVGLGPDGEAVNSCAVRETVLPPSATLSEVTGKHRIAIMSKMTTLVTSGAASLSFDELVEAVAPELDCEEARRRRSVARATINSLHLTGHLHREGDMISLPP